MEKNKFLSKIFYSPDGCWYWLGAFHPKFGYGYVNIIPEKRTTVAHRHSFRLFKGAIPDGMKVCHSCDNPRCVNPDHLWLGTQQENIKDMISKKRNKGPVGTRNSHCEITEEQAKNIIGLISIGLQPSLISKCRRVSRETVANIKRGLSWTHLNDGKFTVSKGREGRYLSYKTWLHFRRLKSRK